MRVLALVPGDISEQILFLPTLESLKQAFPNANFGVVVEPRAKSAYSVSKLVDDVIAFDYRAANSPADWANLLGILRDREFEVALSASPRWEEGVLLWLSGIPTRIADSNTRTPWLYTQTVPASDSSYPADRYRALLTGLQVPANDTQAELNVPEGDIVWADAQREQLGLKEGYVMIYPGSVGGDAYPTESWLKIIEDFQTKQPQMALALLKDDASQAMVSTLSRRQQALKVVEPDNIGQTAALLAGADLVLTPESYVMQLAVALKVFTLAMLGADKAPAALPAANGSETRFLGIQSPTGNLSDLSPDTVLQKVWGG
ncbi:MAG: glycosyltransferase family 9 protein [Cyanobacteria bacterium P01_D01_bin.14]